MNPILQAEIGRFAASLILDQADEDDILDFEHSDIEDDEDERLRQQAESVPLRPSDYVDPVEAVAAQWLAKQAEKVLQPSPVSIRSRKGPLILSSYDAEDPDDLAIAANPPSSSVSNSFLEHSISDPLPAPPLIPPSTDLPAPPTVLPSAVPPPIPPSSDLPVPPPVSPSAVPQAVVDFLVDSLTQQTCSSIPDSFARETQAWNLLNDYLNGILEGDRVKTGLDELQVSDGWDAMRIRIMQIEPGEDDKAAELQHSLNKMKPTQESDVVDDPTDMDVDLESEAAPVVAETSAINYDDEDEDEYDPIPLSKEQQELADFVHTYLGRATELEDHEIFHVRCRRGKESAIVQRIQRDYRRGKVPRGIYGAFPSMLPGGFYIRCRSMLQSYTNASSYFRTINGFIYPRQPVVAHPPNTVVPVASRDVHLLMPIHRRVVGLSSLTEESLYRPQNNLIAGTWVTTNKGLYREDVGLILEDGYGIGLKVDLSFECVVGFLPRIALTKQPSKKPKLIDSSRSPPSPASTYPVGHTLSSILKGTSDYISANQAQGFPVPAESVVPVKRKRPSSRPRNPKVYQGCLPIGVYARSNSIRISKPHCHQCVSPQTCQHIGGRYTLSGQRITKDGIALVVLKYADLQEARTIPSKDLFQWLTSVPEIINTRLPLPSSWYFDYGERVQLSLQYATGSTRNVDVENSIAAGAEGWIDKVLTTGCEVAFIDKAKAKGGDQCVTAMENMLRFIPHRFLLKVMRPGDRVEIQQRSSVPVEGLVVGVGDRVTVKLQLRDNEMQTFHPNSLKNLSLTPRIQRVHDLLLPHNVHTLIQPDPRAEASTLDTSTGRAPWVGTEIKIFGTEHHGGVSQMHKGEVGRVIDVKVDLSMRSGLAILIRFDAPSTSLDTFIDFDRIRRRDNSHFLAYSLHACSHFQFKPGYTPDHSYTELYYHAYSHPKTVTEIEDHQEKVREDEERARKVEQERLAIQNHGSRLEGTKFTQGGAPFELRTGTPPPSTDWIDEPEITKVLPRGKVMVALRGRDDDVEVTIATKDGLNEAAYFVKPKNQPAIKTLITAQHLDPLKASHTAFKSYSPKLFLVCSGEHAGRLGRAVFWGVADDVVLKPFRLELQEAGAATRKQRFREIPVDGPFLRVMQKVCAHVPMMPDEEKIAKSTIPTNKLYNIFEKQALGLPITDDEKVLVGIV